MLDCRNSFENLIEKSYRVKIDTPNTHENDSVFLNFIKTFEFLPITGSAFQRELCHLI